MKTISVFLFCLTLTGCMSSSSDHLPLNLSINDAKQRLQDFQQIVRMNTGLSISPDIKAKGFDGPIYHNQDENLSATVSLNSQGNSVDSDWWVAAQSPFGWFYFDLVSMKWVYAGESYTGLSQTYQGPLFDVSPFEVLNMSGLPEGGYILYFGIDTNMNGSLDFDQLFFDFVSVDVIVDGQATIKVPLGTLGENVSVKAGESKTISFVSELFPGGGPFTDISIDLNAVLDNVIVEDGGNAVSKVSDVSVKAGELPPAAVAVRIESASNTDTVCENGYLIGTYTVGVNSSNQPSSVSPASEALPQSVISVINAGPFAICTEITYPVDSILTLNAVDFDTTICDEPPAGISGAWKGTYFCANTGCSDFSGAVSITITQDDYSAHYVDDSNAKYDGSVCGNVFRFNGGILSSFTEQGTFVLNDDGTASKTSSWVANNGSCRGDCTDSLHR